MRLPACAGKGEPPSPHGSVPAQEAPAVLKMATTPPAVAATICAVS